MRRPLLLSALFAVVLSACAPTVWPPLHTPPLDLGGPAPDVVIFAVSGRCQVGCTAPRDNWDYLTARGTVDRLADAFAAAGYRVQVAGYASHTSTRFTSRLSLAPQRGYAALLGDYTRLRNAWPDSPPRVVLFGHSQGSVWLHHLARVTPEQPVALQIDVDGICLSWLSDHGAAMRRLTTLPPLPSPAEACNVYRVAGQTVFGKDIVWPNVALNLEVQSKRLPAPAPRPGSSGGLPVNYLFEITPNLRPDGSRNGIEGYVSVREDHSAVSYPDSDAMRWVTGRAAQIAQDWRREDAARQP